MTEQRRSMSDVLGATDERIRSGGSGGARVWPTGFSPLDDHLAGGLRAGELVLVGGAQGVGKTTLVLQLFRNLAAAGHSALYFSYEHDETDLLARVLVQEAFERAAAATPTLQELRRRLERPPGAAGDGLPSLLDGLAGMEQAQLALEEYGARLAVVESSSRRTSADVVRELVLEARAAGASPVVFVDYLQKVAVGASLQEDERVTLVVEALKDLALEASVAVVAIVAASSEGIVPGHRLRVHELRGSSALAYEADVILLLNHKHDIVAKRHLAYDSRSAERFRQIVVVSIEKNRTGRDGVDLEFAKQFEHCRFDPVGNVVAEQLVDERVQES